MMNERFKYYLELISAMYMFIVQLHQNKRTHTCLTNVKVNVFIHNGRTILHTQTYSSLKKHFDQQLLHCQTCDLGPSNCGGLKLNKAADSSPSSKANCQKELSLHPPSSTSNLPLKKTDHRLYHRSLLKLSQLFSTSFAYDQAKGKLEYALTYHKHNHSYFRYFNRKAQGKHVLILLLLGLYKDTRIHSLQQLENISTLSDNLGLFVQYQFFVNGSKELSRTTFSHRFAGVITPLMSEALREDLL